MKKNKIAIVLPSFSPQGPFIVATNVALNISSNYDVIYISLRDREDEVNSILHGQEVFFLGMGKIPSLSIMRKLNSVLYLNSIDLVFAHGFWPTVLVGRSLETKRIVTVHNNPSEDYVMAYGRFVGWCMAKVFTRYLDRYDSIICISDYVKNIIKVKNNSRVSVIYNGVESLDCFKLPREKFSEDNISLVLVSALIPRKDIYYALKLVKYVISKGVEVKLDIIGDGPLRTILENESVQIGIQDRVFFRGQKTYNETQSLISRADIFLFTSLSEGFGLVLVEAMMLGTVVIARYLPVVKEVLGCDDLIFHSENDFYNKLLEVKKNHIKYQCYCQNRYHNKFSLDQMSFNYERVFDSILLEDA